MYEYTRFGRHGMGALGTDPFAWRSQDCSGGDGVTMGAGEVACVPSSEVSRARRRGCVPTTIEWAEQCASGAAAYCCPERSKVREIQQAIIDSGCQLPSFGVDGLWGSETASGVLCMINRDGWESVARRFAVVRGLVEPPTGGAASTVTGSVTGSVRNIVTRSYGSLGAWGYVGIGAAALVLGFAISQMMKGKSEEEREEEAPLIHGRPSMAGAY